MLILFWLSQTWHVTLKIQEKVFFGCTLLRCGDIFGGVDISEVLGCHLRWVLSVCHKNYFKDWCLMNSQPTFLFLTYVNLKFVSTIFYQFFIFSPNDSPLKTTKYVFYFIWKALFVLIFLWFFPFLSTLPKFKKTNGSEIIYDVVDWHA